MAKSIDTIVNELIKIDLKYNNSYDCDIAQYWRNRAYVLLYSLNKENMFDDNSQLLDVITNSKMLNSVYCSLNSKTASQKASNNNDALLSCAIDMLKTAIEIIANIK